MRYQNALLADELLLTEEMNFREVLKEILVQADSEKLEQPEFFKDPEDAILEIEQLIEPALRFAKESRLGFVSYQEDNKKQTREKIMEIAAKCTRILWEIESLRS